MSPNTSDALPRQFTLGYLIALTVIACLAGGTWVAQHQMLSRQAADAPLINVSGRQRMLSQRIAFYTLQVARAEAPDEARQQLSTAMSEFKAAHEAILDGSAELRLSGVLSKEERSYYHTVLTPQVSAYLDAATAVLAAPAGGLDLDHPPVSEVIEQASGPLLQKLHKAVLMHEQTASQGVGQLQVLEMSALMATLAILMLEAMLVFRPLIKKLEQTLDALNQQDLVNRALSEAQDARQQLQEALDATPVGIIAWESDGALLYCNDLFKEMHPALAPMLQPPATYAEVLQLADTLNLPPPGLTRATLPDGTQGDRRRLSRMAEERLDGKDRWALVNHHLSSSGRLLSTWTDISQRKAFEAQLTKLAHTDALTGVANRERFYRVLERALQDASTSAEVISVVMLDLDKFKPVNDTWGHPVGDMLLQQVAQRLRQTLRNADLVARFGGDEFALILRDSQDVQTALKTGDRIVEALTRPFEVESHLCTISTSVGLSMCPQHSTSPDQLVRLADVALYAAKASGGAECVAYEPSMGTAVRAGTHAAQRLSAAPSEI